jgi:hypothetical protein
VRHTIFVLTMHLPALPLLILFLNQIFRADHLAFCQRVTDATDEFLISYQNHFQDCSRSASYWYLPLQQTRDTAYTLACQDWRTALGDLLPSPRPPYRGEWDPP